MTKKIILIGGGTISHVRNHLALCAPAYGKTVNDLFYKLNDILREKFMIYDPHGWELDKYEVKTYLTKMAGDKLHESLNPLGKPLETNEDISNLIDLLIKDKDVRVIIFNPALVDFSGKIDGIESGKYAERLETKNGSIQMELTPTDKIIGKIRKERKDIFVVGFKTTANATSHEQYKKGLELLKKNSLNLVLANDTVTRNNMIVAPEETRYFETTKRNDVLTELARMVISRMQNTFTRSTVVEGKPIDWNSELVPENLRTVVNHCIKKGAYKPVLGKTAGHFAVKLNDGEILTSIRKTNFNELEKVGLVRVEYDGVNTVKAHGAKPSVGGMSQRIIFSEHGDAECIVHFHCPPNENIECLAWSKRVDDYKFKKDQISIKPQTPNECGSHQCGASTSAGLGKIDLGDGDYLKAVYLDNHGPNIVFNKSVPAEKIINYIDSTFNLSTKTGGLV